MNNQIILQGITLDELMDGLRTIVRDEIKAKEEVYELTKAEACRRLDISFPTLKKRMKRENIDIIYNTNLSKLAIK